MTQSFEIPIKDAQSMTPLLQSGDIVLVASSPQMTLNAGSLYLFHTGGEFVVHRYLNPKFKGDNSLGDEEVAFEKIFGEVIALRRDNKIYPINKLSSGWPLVRLYPSWAPRRTLRRLLKLYLAIFLAAKSNYSAERT